MLTEDAIREITDLGRQSVTHRIEPFQLGSNNVEPLALIHKDFNVTPLKEYIPREPDRKRIKVDLYDMESFIGYVNEQKNENTRIFATHESPFMFKAAIDYHGTANQSASWITHLCILNLVETPEWKNWCKNNEQSMEQLEFVEFLQDNRKDIKDPDGATILEIVNTLELTHEGRCLNKMDMNSGSVHFEFKEDIAAKAGRDGSIDIPKTIKIMISPFEGCEKKPMEIDFRFRQYQGKIKFSYKMSSLQNLITSVVTETVKSIKEKVQLPVYFGDFSKS